MKKILEMIQGNVSTLNTPIFLSRRFELEADYVYRQMVRPSYSITCQTSVETAQKWSQNFSQITNLFLCAESIKISRTVAVCKLLCLRSYNCRPSTSHEGIQGNEVTFPLTLKFNTICRRAVSLSR
jgi:hypothetical protein